MDEIINNINIDYVKEDSYSGSKITTKSDKQTLKNYKNSSPIKMFEYNEK